MPAYKDDKDDRWRYRFAFKGKRYSGSAPKGHNTKKVAEQLERELIEKLQNRTFTGVVPTIAEFAARFLDYQKSETKQLTHELHETIVTLHIVPHVGKLRLNEITRAELDGLKAVWDAAPRTKNTRLGVLMRMLSLAQEWGLLVTVPKVKLVKVPRDTPRFLSDHEARRLLDAAKPNWRPMVFVALRTGLRIGELRGLQWGDVDFTRAVIHVRRTDPGRPEMKPNAPKGNRPRQIPLTPETLTTLHAWHATLRHTGAKDWVFPGAENWRAERGRRRGRAGGGCTRACTEIATKAGLEDVTWHTLRHTYASGLVMRGVMLSVVQELLGHASVRQTERYAHLAPGFAQHIAVAMLDTPLMGPSRAPLELGAGESDPVCQPATNGTPTPSKKRSRRA